MNIQPNSHYIIRALGFRTSEIRVKVLRIAGDSAIVRTADLTDVGSKFVVGLENFVSEANR